VFFESGVEEFAVPESVLGEVRAYIPAFSTKTGLPQDVLDFLLELLPLTLYAASTYRRTIPEAVRLIGRRDPDDVAPLLSQPRGSIKMCPATLFEALVTLNA